MIRGHLILEQLKKTMAKPGGVARNWEFQNGAV